MHCVFKHLGSALVLSRVMKKTGVTGTGTGSRGLTVVRGGRAATAETAKAVNAASPRSCTSVAARAATTGTQRRACVMRLTAETREAEINGLATEVKSKIRQVGTTILQECSVGRPPETKPLLSSPQPNIRANPRPLFQDPL